jgi:hypothetical protein
LSTDLLIVLFQWKIPTELLRSAAFTQVQYRHVNGDNTWTTFDTRHSPQLQSMTLTSLPIDTTYTFRVIVLTGDDQSIASASSAPIDLRLPIKSTHDRGFSPSPASSLVAPSRPPDLMLVRPISRDALELTWTYGREEGVVVDGFLVQFRIIYSARGEDDASFVNVSVLGGLTRMHTIDHLLPATPYKVQVRAVNAAGVSPASNSMLAYTDGWCTHS